MSRYDHKIETIFISHLQATGIHHKPPIDRKWMPGGEISCLATTGRNQEAFILAGHNRISFIMASRRAFFSGTFVPPVWSWYQMANAGGAKALRPREPTVNSILALGAWEDSVETTLPTTKWFLAAMPDLETRNQLSIVSVSRWSSRKTTTPRKKT
jgi:hypothetical protein